MLAEIPRKLVFVVVNVGNGRPHYTRTDTQHEGKKPSHITMINIYHVIDSHLSRRNRIAEEFNDKMHLAEQR